MKSKKKTFTNFYFIFDITQGIHDLLTLLRYETLLKHCRNISVVQHITNILQEYFRNIVISIFSRKCKMLRRYYLIEN